MNPIDKKSRILGVAFLLQFITSFSSGLFLVPALFVSENISENLINIADNPVLMRANILVDVLTALGIIFLGAILFITLRNQNEKIALVALGFYILEAALLAASKLAASSLLFISQEYVGTGYPAHLETTATLAIESMDFVGTTLHMLVFCVGAILFYFLLDKSRLLPRILSLWGLITVFICLIATIFVIFGFEVPFAIYLPYVPFEFIVGMWIVVKGI